MVFWLFCTGMTLLIPLMMLGFSRRFQTHPPKSINSFYGYRTARSMKNRQTWDFAHRVCGKIWLRAGIILLLVSLVVMLLARSWSEERIELCCLLVTVLQLVVLVGSILPVERALKHNFDQFGRKR